MARTTTEFEADLRVAAKVSEADGVVSLWLEPLDGRPLPAWEPGAHVDLEVPDRPIRQYSLCGDPGDRSAWRLGILRGDTDTGFGAFAIDTLLVGDTVKVRGPRNHFPLLTSPRYLFIAGGIGITPMLPMIVAAERSGQDWRLVYGGRRRSSMAFLEELWVYGDKVSVCPEDEVGLLPLDELLGVPSPDTKVYCCGPEALLTAVESLCEGWPRGSLRTERFSAPPWTGEPDVDAFEVHLAATDLTVTVRPEESILSVVRAAGIDVMSNCSEGTCGTCETRVLEGTPDHRDHVLEDDEREAGEYMMICVSRCLSPRLVLDL